MEEKIKPHQVTTLHMVSALAFIVTGAIICVYNYAIPLWGGAILVAGLLLTFLVMAKNKWIISPKVNRLFRVAELLIAGSIAIYSVFEHWKFPVIIFGVLSVALLFALYWEQLAGGQLYVHIDDMGVKLPETERRRSKPWTEIEQVIIRFGILTINCADHSLYQWSISNTGIDSEIFEAYCIAKVEESREKRRKDDW